MSPAAMTSNQLRLSAPRVFSSSAWTFAGVVVVAIASLIPLSLASFSSLFTPGRAEFGPLVQIAYSAEF